MHTNSGLSLELLCIRHLFKNKKNGGSEPEELCGTYLHHNLGHATPIPHAKYLIRGNGTNHMHTCHVRLAGVAETKESIEKSCLIA